MPGRKRIVLLHGWGASVGKLSPLGEELHRLGWEVLIPKLPGFDSPPPAEVWGVAEYAEYALRETQKAFGGKKFFLFGHSFGGRLALKLAGMSGEHLFGIVLCSASGLSRGNPVKRAVFWILAKGGKVLLIAPPIAKVWRKALYKLAREHDYEKAGGVMRKVFKRVISENLKPIVRRVKVPTLVLWGREDRVTPVSDARYLKQVLPRAKLVVFDNAGHRLVYHKPQEIAQEIDKWAQNLD